MPYHHVNVEYVSIKLMPFYRYGYAKNVVRWAAFVKFSGWRNDVILHRCKKQLRSGYNGTACDGLGMCVAWTTPVCQTAFYGQNVQTVGVVLRTHPRNNGRTTSLPTSQRISLGASTVTPCRVAVWYDICLHCRATAAHMTAERGAWRGLWCGMTSACTAGRQPLTWRLSAVLGGGCGMTSLASSDVVMILANTSRWQQRRWISADPIGSAVKIQTFLTSQCAICFIIFSLSNSVSSSAAASRQTLWNRRRDREGYDFQILSCILQRIRHLL